MKNNLFGLKVKVYKNLRKNCWSVLYQGIVAEYADTILLQDVKFVVSESGRQRVLKEKQKNVHAFAVGTFKSINSSNSFGLKEEVSYNPYTGNSFFKIKTKDPIHEAGIVWFGINKVFI